jgi:hypothetical protein
VSDSKLDGIPATCEIHHGSGHLVVRREGERLVLDGRGDHCCLFTLDCSAVVRCSMRSRCG